MRRVVCTTMVGIVLILSTGGFNHARVNLADILVWTETTVEDSSDGVLHDVIVTSVYLKTDSTGITPSLNSVSISYLSADTVPPGPPQNLTASPGHSSITLRWDPNVEPDLYSYRIYRGEASASYDPSWTKEVSASETSFADTSAVSEETYFFAVSAVDSNLNESPLSPEVSESPYSMRIYVDAGSPEGGDGSISIPFTAISQAVDVALYGDDIIVLPGAYSETIDMKRGVSLIGSGAQTTHIIGTGSDYVIKAAGEATIKGFTIVRQGSGYINGIQCNRSSPVITENVIINYDDPFGSGNGIDCYRASPVIKNNAITNFDMGIFCGEISSPRIENNVIRSFSAGVFAYDRSHPRILNNTILIQYMAGINYSLFSNPEIRNNIIMGLDNSTTTGINGDIDANATISYNDVWNNLWDYVGSSPGEGDISEDPLFMNVDKKDYRLRENSPCIDAGDPESEYSDVDGSRNDMGAFGGPDPIDPSLTSELVKSVGISSESGFPNDEVSVFVALDNPAGVAKVELVILYEETLLTPIDIWLTDVTRGFSLESNMANPGRIEVSMERAEEIGGGEGGILEISFAVGESALPGDASPLRLEDIFLFDEFSSPFKVRTITDGVFVVIECSGDGNYVYVDDKASGEEDGSCGHPYHTILEGINNASSGDTVLVLSGKYSEQIIMKEGVYVKGSGALSTTLAVGADEVAVEFDHVESGGISGFTITGPANEASFLSLVECRSSSPLITRNRFAMAMPTIPAIYCYNNSRPVIEENSFIGAGIWTVDSSPIIRHNAVSNAGGSGISCRNSPSAMIYGNRVIGDEYGSAGLDIVGSGPVIVANNRVTCATGGGHGIVLGEASNVTITNNIIEDPGSNGTGMSIRNSSDIAVINNTINTRGKGLDEVGSSVTVMNNIVTGNGGFGIHVSSSSMLSYNDIWGNTNNYYDTSPGDHDISEDPLFVDESAGAYYLMAGSPCIDAGNPDPLYNDLDQSRNDMGAYGGPGGDGAYGLAGGSSLRIPSVEALPSDTVQVLVTGESILGIAEVKLVLSYDSSVLSFLGAKTTSETEGFSLTKTNIGNSILELSAWASRGIVEESGDILVIEFIVSQSPRSHSHVRFERANLRDETATERYPLDLENGRVRIMGLGFDDHVESTDLMPISYHLSQNYPNPFNPTTIFELSLPEHGFVTLAVYDLLGRKVATLLNEERDPGYHKVKWNASEVPSGIYFVRMQAGKPSQRSGQAFTQVRKVTVLR